MATPAPWPRVAGLAYGGDYNPEQWPRETWDQDVALMREAGVNLVSVGIFSWVMLEPRDGEFEFGWLDDLLELLHANGIAVDLGTPTAAPPAWFYAKYPTARVITREGVTLGPGSRGMASPSSREYRAAAARIAGALAERYAQHPAVAMWHVHNEYGVPVSEDFSPASAAAFRDWLRERHGSLDALNAAWGTAFWGQRYGTWDEINPPGASASVVNPAQQLDFRRFTDHQLLHCFIAERDAIRAHSSLPVTTNFMANATLATDLFAWGKAVDLVADDHYLTAADPENFIELAIAADLSRSVGAGKPWMLMEHSTSAVNWQPRNVAKRPGEMARNSLAHVARGSDSVMFFQWRASRFGAEKFHSAMLPHAGTDSRVWREVVALGRALVSLAEVQGSRTVADAAILWDTESFWAQDLEWRPTVDHRHQERIRAFYERMWRDGLTVDFVHPTGDLSQYPLVVAPALYLLTAANARRLTDYVAGGGTLVVSYFAGIVDENDALHPGPFGSVLAEALGVWVEEFLPLREGEHGAVAWTGDDAGAGDCDVWQEQLVIAGADVRASYTAGPAAGLPAVTRNVHGDGAAWYASTRLGVDALVPLMRAAYGDAGIVAPARPAGLEVVTRRGADADYVFALNHSDAAVELPASGMELTRGVAVGGSLSLEPGAVAVVRTAAAPEGGDHSGAAPIGAGSPAG